LPSSYIFLFFSSSSYLGASTSESVAAKGSQSEIREDKEGVGQCNCVVSASCIKYIFLRLPTLSQARQPSQKAKALLDKKKIANAFGEGARLLLLFFSFVVYVFFQYNYISTHYPTATTVID
jgi:hypothetical protein